MTTKNETRTPQVERPKFLVSIVERGKGKAIINLYNKEGVNYTTRQLVMVLRPLKSWIFSDWIPRTRISSSAYLPGQ